MIMSTITIIKLGGDSLTEIESARVYVEDVFADIQQARKKYPFIEATLLPTVDPTPIQLRVVAVNKSLLEQTNATCEDFVGPYSKELEIIVPFDYKNAGCKVYGGKWIDTIMVKEEYQHFNGKRKDSCYLFCVGVPESFPQMENVILENIKTAEKILIAYELYQTGETKILELNAYSHGTKGINEYIEDKKKYKGK